MAEDFTPGPAPDPAADLRADPAFSARLYNSDHRVAEAAAKELSAIYQRAYPEPGQAPPADAGPRGGLWPGSPPALADADHGVPPGPEHYVVSPAIEEDAPVLASELRSWAHQSRLSVADLSELSSHIVRLDDGSSHAPAVLEAQGRGTIEQLSATAEGRRTLERARSAWRSLEHYNPKVAEALNGIGASADLAFVETLARSWRG